MYIGIDLGGTNVRVAGSKSLEKVELVEIKRFELSHDFERDFAEINRAIEKIAEGKVDGIGIGTSGTYNDDRSLLTSGRNIKEWVNIPFVEKLSKKFNCSVFADNDAVVASLGESFYGQENVDGFIYITWGTGVGGAVISNDNGKIISEKLDWHEYLEKIDSNCGGKGLARKFKKEASKLNDEEWTEIVNDFENYLLEISEKINQKEIVLGGGMAERQKGRLQKVVNNLKEKGINLRISSFGHDGGLYGAMALMEKGIENQDDIKLNIHPLFKIVEKEFISFVVSQNMMSIPSFQRELVKIHDGKLIEVGTSVNSFGFQFLRFDVKWVLNSFNKENKILYQDKEITGNMSGSMIRHGRLLVIVLHDLLKNGNYYKEIHKSKTFKFLQHLRNGSAHDNKFNFERKLITDCSWRGKVVKQSSEGEQVFGEFIYLPDIMILMNDLSDELDEIDMKERVKKDLKSKK